MWRRIKVGLLAGAALAGTFLLAGCNGDVGIGVGPVPFFGGYYGPYVGGYGPYGSGGYVVVNGTHYPHYYGYHHFYGEHWSAAHFHGSPHASYHSTSRGSYHGGYHSAVHR